MEWATSTLPSRGRQVGGIVCNPLFSGVPNKGDKIKIGYLTPPFSAALKWVELPHKPYVLGVPSKRDKKKGYITPAMSGGHKWAESNCYANPCVLGEPQQRGQNWNGLPPPCLRGAAKWVELYVTPCSRGSPTKGTKSKLATSPLHSRRPSSGLNCHTSPMFSGFPAKGTKKTGNITPAMSGGHKWAQSNCYANPCVLGEPQQRGQNWNGLPPPCLRGATKWVELYVTPCSRGSPTKGTKSKLATSPLHSRRPSSGLNCYTSPMFSGLRAKSQKNQATSPLLCRGATSGQNLIATQTLAFSGNPSRGDKIGMGYLHPAFAGPPSGWNCM